MLRSLSIRDFAIVDHLELEFAPGFTALTGETGAGKSILIEALSLALGERGDSLVVRQGADRAEVSAEFDISANIRLARWLDQNDLTGGESTCLMRRVVEPAGRSRSYINGRAVTLAQLREVGEALVDIHGQHQHQSLLRAATQRELLDGFGALGNVAEDVARSYDRWQRLHVQRMHLERDASGLAAERETLAWQVRELEALRFSTEEWQALAAEHARLTHGASLARAAQSGLELLSEGDGCASSQVNRAIAWLEEVVAYDAGLRGILEILQPAQAQLQEAIYALRRYGERLDIDPRQLQEVALRLDAIYAVARRHQVDPDRLPEILNGAQSRLETLGAAGDIETLQRAEDEARAACLAQAKRLSAGRATAAKRLGEQVTTSMQQLAMVGGQLDVALLPLSEVTRTGLEQIEFRVAAHKGMTPLPLSRVASGGEISRVSLAIQTVASRVAQVPTLIFDEVDAGIGGRVAEIVGKMLSHLGKGHQVLCVTHLPQVAASADQQWQVSKSTVNGAVQSQVIVLRGDQRVDEIARMLGGVRITETTRKHAAEMLGARR